ncbi:hypothetical protein L596_026915 [Steinernema carpocapsae]|uniref:glucuronosyltransferase n=1 Tax=Steinernema carpocapsae TaxID=34508 RepID=A0A4U5M2S4_STECR|nr:hypothetical protein L596_026915 [Steinernema carpocapsae]
MGRFLSPLTALTLTDHFYVALVLKPTMATSTRLLLFLALLWTANGIKILMYSPKFGSSHVSFMGRLADILVEEGMDVTVVLPQMNPFIVSNGTKLAKTIIIYPCQSSIDYHIDTSFLESVWVKDSTNPVDQKMVLDRIIGIHVDQCGATLSRKELLEFLRNEKFDLGISEALLFDFCAMGIFEEIGLEKHVLIGTSLLWEYVADLFGAPNLPAVVPGLFTAASNQMSYIERALNLLKIQLSKNVGRTSAEGYEAIVEMVLGRKINIEEKLSQASFVITNGDPLLDFPRPFTERIVNIGGISVPKPKPLNAFWENVVTDRKATVLMSFGSVAQSYTMPKEMKKAILETFKRFPEVTFIWKYEKDEDEVAKGYPNVVTNKWVPQNDLLNHPNLKLFITHAGMNSILETSRRGVPVITIPLFGDQLRNAEMVKRLGTAQIVDKKMLFDSDQFEAKLKESLENPSHLTSATRLSQMMAKRPRNQRQELVNHVKFAAEFGYLPEYRIPQVSFMQYYMLDIFILLFVVLSFITLSISYGLYKLSVKLFTKKVKTA